MGLDRAKRYRHCQVFKVGAPGKRNGLKHWRQNGLRLPDCRVAEVDAKLFSTKTADNVVGPQTAAQPISDGDQALIPDLVAVGVVDTFEVVRVQDDQHPTRIMLQGTAHLRHEPAPVRQVGHGISAGLERQFDLQPGLFADQQKEQDDKGCPDAERIENHIFGRQGKFAKIDA